MGKVGDIAPLWAQEAYRWRQKAQTVESGLEGDKVMIIYFMQ